MGITVVAVLVVVVFGVGGHAAVPVLVYQVPEIIRVSLAHIRGDIPAEGRGNPVLPHYQLAAVCELQQHAAVGYGCVGRTV